MTLTTQKISTGFLCFLATAWSTSPVLGVSLAHRSGGRSQAALTQPLLAYRATGRSALVASAYRASERGIG
ncbi:MAG: hypothetical protein HC824_00745 [Synechococcales cyanobacterium RM1_1_8]|nr:hypothetical protein [Synechococcales cyanobacterium RM1_1_8]